MEYHIEIQTDENGDVVTGANIAGMDADTRLGIEQDGDTFEADGPYGRTTYDSLVDAVLSSLGEAVPVID